MNLLTFFTGGVDYKSGPYEATFKKGKKTTKFCIDIMDDNNWEVDENFGLEISDRFVRASPYRANVTVIDNEGM